MNIHDVCDYEQAAANQSNSCCKRRNAAAITLCVFSVLWAGVVPIYSAGVWTQPYGATEREREREDEKDSASERQTDGIDERA